MHSKKDVRRINDREDYEKSGFKVVMDEVDKDKEEALNSVPEIHYEQVPKNGDTTKEPLSGDSENDAGTNNQMSKFGKGFVIPDDKTSS